MKSDAVSCSGKGKPVFCEGWDAHREGRGLGDNPHPEGALHWEWWRDGWLARKGWEDRR